MYRGGKRVEAQATTAICPRWWQDGNQTGRQGGMAMQIQEAAAEGGVAQDKEFWLSSSV